MGTLWCLKDFRGRAWTSEQHVSQTNLLTYAVSRGFCCFEVFLTFADPNRKSLCHVVLNIALEAELPLGVFCSEDSEQLTNPPPRKVFRTASIMQFVSSEMFRLTLLRFIDCSVESDFPWRTRHWSACIHTLIGSLKQINRQYWSCSDFRSGCVVVVTTVQQKKSKLWRRHDFTSVSFLQKFFFLPSILSITRWIHTRTQFPCVCLVLVCVLTRSRISDFNASVS